jgi:hypothetical protein
MNKEQWVVPKEYVDYGTYVITCPDCKHHLVYFTDIFGRLFSKCQCSGRPKKYRKQVRYI